MNHGTTYAYDKKKCRCDPCRTRHNTRVAENRRNRLLTGRINHGTRSAYDAGCRCGQCREVRLRISKREKMDLVMALPGHNHKVKDIKPLGRCPACDDYMTGAVSIWN